jgi:phosphoglycolate phosphatase-like HAD superfamily hydrolase
MGQRKTITAVITDLDNTLYDWVTMWHASFKAMLDALVSECGVPAEQLERDFQAVFQRHGTSEYAFAIQELASLQAKYPGADLAARFDATIHAYSRARKATLALYPSVEKTLRMLRSKGCLVVGYTESMAFYTNYRLRKLGLDGLLDYLYSPVDHDLPLGLSPEQIRHYHPDTYRLHHTQHKHTPKGVLKPSPEVLLDIIREVGADREGTIYVGDNLVKDVGMAQAAGIIDVFAAYGAAQEREEYELLRRVTHWTQAAVKAEQGATITPSYTLKSFKDLPKIFEFTPFVQPRKKGDPQMGEVLEAWKTTVQVQMHFNDLGLRIRNFALTLLSTTLGAAALAFQAGAMLPVRAARLPLAGLLLVAGTVGWLGCYLMDRFWYHRLLKGAVAHGLFVEERLRDVLPEAGLTGAIARASPNRVLGPIVIHSTARVDIFYLGIAVVLVAAAAMILLGHHPAASALSDALSDF